MSDTNQATAPVAGDAHRRLDVFVGDWHTEGTSFADGQAPDGPRASAVPWKSDEPLRVAPRRVDGDVWRFSEPSTRATVTVRDGGKHIDHVWEWRHGAGAWLPLCERTATRA
jgi:hypothetical protein